MALPTLDAVFASAANAPRRYMLAQWLVNELGSGSVADYITLPERYLWAKIAVAAGAPKDEAAYIGLPKQYAWKDIYDAVSGSSLGTIDWGEKQALGHIAAAYRGDTGTPENLATYINWPWRYQVASIIVHTAIDSDVLAFVAASGATDVAGLDAFVKGVKDLGLWDSMVSWPLRSSQNAGTGTTAYSLGGLGTFNGTLVNSPTWGTDGISFDSASSQQIEWTTSPLSDFTSGHAMLGVFLPSGPVPTSATSTSQLQILQGAVVVVEYGSGGTGGTSTGLAQYRITTGRNISAFFAQANLKDKWTVYEHDPQPSVRVFNSGGNAAHGDLAAGTFVYDPDLSMTMGATADGTNTTAFWAIFAAGTNILSASEALRTLYKQTLGIGLDLP